jgi:hypothetical protein
MREPAHHHVSKEVIFYSPFFPGYYGSMSSQDGYGGFNFTGLVEYLNTPYFSRTTWCDNGYTNVAAATGAYTLSFIPYYGTMVSAKPTESFTLSSFVAASAWCTHQEFTITTYTYANGTFTEKGSINEYLSQSAQTIKLGKLGRNIAEIHFATDGLGAAGNTCSYGAGTYGYQLVWADVKVKWNGKIPTSNGLHTLPGHHHVAPHAAQIAHAAHVASATHQGSAHHTNSGYHSQLLAFGHDPGGLTAEFNLPQTEHFGL